MASAGLAAPAPPDRTPPSRTTAAKTYAHLRFDFSRIDFSRFGAVGRTDDTVSFHLLDHSCRTVVSYPQSSLNHRYRSLLGFSDDCDRLIIHLVIFLVGCRGGIDLPFGFQNFR